MSELRALADSWNYGPALNMLRDRLVDGVNDNHIQHQLLTEGHLSLGYGACSGTGSIQGVCLLGKYPLYNISTSSTKPL